MWDRAAPILCLPAPRALDLGGALVCPGFLDLQVNGLGGDALLTSDVAGVRRIARELARRGTTAFLPTLTTAPRDELIRAARVVREAWALQREEGAAEARILGVHLEGPYLEARMRGAHPGEHIRTPSKEEVEAIARAAGGLGVGGAPGLAMVTLSPEVAGAAEFTRWLAENRVVPAMGHTQGMAGLRGGVFGRRAARSRFMRSIATGIRRLPRTGVASPMDFVQNDARLSAGLIADGAHVAPQRIRSFVRARGWERTVLTSDLVADGGLRPQADAEETNDEMPGDALMREGVLSGSRLTISQMLPRFRKWGGLEVACALATATRNPARVLGAGSEQGRLAPGLRADFCVLDSDSLEPIAVMIGGAWISGPAPIAGE